MYTEDFYAVNIRKSYDDNEIDFNEDGYKYEMIFLSMERTRDYLFMLDRGYDVRSLFPNSIYGITEERANLSFTCKGKSPAGQWVFIGQ